MPKKTIGSYGTWESPITSDLIVADTVGLMEARAVGEDVYWIEIRPQEKGRSVIVRRRPDGQVEEVTPAPFSARTRVHEYGGGAFAVHEDTVYFANFSDQRIYRQHLGSEPEPITPEGAMRYADMVMAPNGRGMVAVREDHSVEGREAVNTLVWLEPNGGGEGEILAAGNDFYASPRFDPKGERLAWLSWNHPNMPWDGTELWIADISSNGVLSPPKKVAGGVTESIFQPEWSPGGVLHFVSDRTGWWNLYRWNSGEPEELCPMEAEFGRPQWVFGLSTYGFASETRIVAVYEKEGRSHLARLDTESNQLESIPTPHTQIWKIGVEKGSVIMIGGSPDRPPELVRFDLSSDDIEVVRRSNALLMDDAHLSIPEAIEFPTTGGLTAHAFFYPAKNDGYSAPGGEKPPLLVMSHGGPTSATDTTLNLRIQYWTSRGIAVVDVNYGGSTGYGREYRERLNGRWGLVDVADCINAAQHLIDMGCVDPQRVAIRGGSAGGYTTLAALTFHDFFGAGASYYGVSDLEILARDTHKFESRYLDSMIGPYPEQKGLYVERSPVHFVDRLSCPVIFFQGLEDRVVPPNQTELMFDAVRKRGFPTAYVAFEGEDHGFRKAENIKRSLDAELYFYGRVFRFEPADDIEPVQIENLPERKP